MAERCDRLGPASDHVELHGLILAYRCWWLSQVPPSLRGASATTPSRLPFLALDCCAPLAMTLSSAARVRKQSLAQDRVHTPIAVDDLRHAKIDRGRHQRDRLVLGESFGLHQEAAFFVVCFFF